MNPEARRFLRQAARQSIQEWSFLFCDDAESESNKEVAADFLEANIEYQGPLGKGALSLMAPDNWAGVLNAGVLGQEPGSAVADRESLGELLNIILGKYLLLKYGPESRFDRNVPKVQASSKEKAETFFRLGALALAVEGITIYFSVTSGQ